MTSNNGRSEIDVDIKGHDIPLVTWIFIGMAILLVGLGVCVSFIVRGSIAMKAPLPAIEQAVQLYADDLSVLPAVPPPPPLPDDKLD